MAKFYSFVEYHKRLFGHKYIESQFIHTDGSWILFSLHWSRKTDHAGLLIQLGILGYEFHLQVYDSRKWNDAESDWETPLSRSQKIDFT